VVRVLHFTAVGTLFESRSFLLHYIKMYMFIHMSPGIESLLVRHFLHRFILAPGTIQPPVKWVPGVCPGDKATRAWRWSPTPIQLRG
jgi:hypothetical protein